jgi:hypothetical protein
MSKSAHSSSNVRGTFNQQEFSKAPKFNLPDISLTVKTQILVRTSAFLPTELRGAATERSNRVCEHYQR